MKTVTAFPQDVSYQGESYSQMTDVVHPQPALTESPKIKEITFNTDDKNMKKFERFVNEDIAYVNSQIDQRFTNPVDKQQVVDLLYSGSAKDVIQKTSEIAESLRMDEFLKQEPYGYGGAFVRGFDDTYSLGLISGAIDAAKGSQERARLFEKTYPVSTTAGKFVGFFPGLIRKAIVGGLVKAGVLELGENKIGKLLTGGSALFEGSKMARKAVGKYAEEYIAKNGESALMKTIQKAGTANGFITRAVDMGLGQATFGVAHKAVEMTGDALEGRPVIHPVDQLWNVGKVDAVGGALIDLGLSALGSSLVVGKNLLTAGTKKGLSSMTGMPEGYISKNLDVIENVLETTPEEVLAVNAKKVLESSREYRAGIITEEQAIKKVIDEKANTIKSLIQDERKRHNFEVSNAYDADKAVLDKTLQQSGINLGEKVNELRAKDAHLTSEVASEFESEFQKGFSDVGKKWASDTDEVIANSSKPIVSGRQTIEKINELLSDPKWGVIKDGKVQDVKQWNQNAYTNRGEIGNMLRIWERYGGEAFSKSKGNIKAKNIPINEMIGDKRGVAQGAGFNKAKSDSIEWMNQQVFHSMKNSVETALPELKPINEKYVTDRTVLDNFAAKVGKSNDKIQTFIEKKLPYLSKGSAVDNMSLNYFNALGQISPELAAAQHKAADLKEQLRVLGGFGKEPKDFVNDVTSAYIRQDQAMIMKLEEAAQKRPELAPYLEHAQGNAKVIKELSDQAAILKASREPDFEARIKEARPELFDTIEEQKKLTKLAQEKAAFDEAYSTKPKVTEKRLSTGFTTQAEREQQALLEQQNPEVAKQMSEAEVARNVRDVEKNISKTPIESISLLGVGPTLFNFRKRLSEPIFRWTVKVARMNKDFQDSVAMQMFSKINGTEGLPKEKILQMSKIIGIQAALMFYGQNGGEDDLMNAIEQTGTEMFEMTKEGE